MSKLTEADIDAALQQHFPPPRFSAVVPLLTEAEAAVAAARIYNTQMAAHRDAQDTVPCQHFRDGACQQRRFCGCKTYPDEAGHAATDVGAEDNKPPMTRSDRRTLVALLTASAALVCWAGWLIFMNR